MLRACAVLQHRETGWGAVSTPSLYTRPAGLTALLPWAPGAPGPTTLLFQGGLCFIVQLTVWVPITNLGEQQAQVSG